MSLMPAVVQTPEVVQTMFPDLMRLNHGTLRKLLDLNSPPWEVKGVKETKRILATKLSIIANAGVIGGSGGGAGDGNEGGDGGGDADDRHGDGNNDDGEGGGGDDDGDDEEDGNNNAGFEEEIIQIWVRTNVGTEDFKTYSLWVSPDDTIWTLKAVLRQMLDIPRGMQSLFLHGLCENAELLLEGRIYTMRTTINGGGKRATGGAAKTQGKEAEMKMLHDSMQMLLLRLQANLNASPVMPKINEAVMKQNAVSEDVSCDFLEELLVGRGLNEKGLDKLLMITTVSTRKEERCKQITAILFAGEIAMLNELGALATSGKTVLELSVQLVISKMFMDPTGLLAWEKFVAKIGGIIKKMMTSNFQTVPERLPM